MRHLLLFFLMLASVQSYSQIKLPRLISNGMILQRDTKANLWGRASPGEKIRLHFNGKEFSAVTKHDGKWMIQIPGQKAGGPHQLVFSASDTITISNILFGDVWICSGQSNMELTMDRVQDKYPDEVQHASYSEIREFLVPDKYDFNHVHDDVEAGEWKPADRDHILRFSAVGYFFARELQKKLNVPIGLINASLGGSPAEAWIGENSLKKFPASYAGLQEFKDQRVIDEIEKAATEKTNAWFSQLNRTDTGIHDRWSAADVDDEQWNQMDVPGYWADGPAGNVNGVFWFRKEIMVPAKMVGKPAKLLLGRIVDADSVFVNGKFAGTTGYLYPPRKYSLRPDILTEGRNTIAIRVINSSGNGGFVPDKPYRLIVGTDSINLSGKWKYKPGAIMEAMPASTVVRWKPAGLYNAMIAPLFHYRVKGVIWYQGESNADNPAGYSSVMSTLIRDWRAHWNEKGLPFLFVQLAGFMETKSVPAESNWAQLRMEQFKIASVPNTGMAVAIDLGEWNDVHPLNKYEVGRRLALQAFRVAYHNKSLVASGPMYKSVARKGHKLEITFTDTGSGMIAAGNRPLQYFSVAGADGQFAWANATIAGDKVIVSNDSITMPISVRYAWADNPAGANVCNKEGLPASPFEARLE